MKVKMHLHALLILGLSYQLQHPLDSFAKESAAIKSSPPVSSVYQTTLRGKVVNDKGEGIAGVTIKNLSAGHTVQSSADGTFTIQGKVSDKLSFTYVGYDALQYTVSDTAPMTITLSNSSVVLEDITITGYTSYAKKLSSNVATTIQAKAIEQVPMASLDQVLQGRVPGMSVLASSGQPGANASVIIRGVGSINGVTTPLYVVDGIPISASELKNYNSNDFENVTVLRDASAKSLYGSRGSNGVIVITTKKGKAGGLSVNYTSQYGVSKLTRPKFQMMNSEQRLRFEEEVGLEMDDDIGPGWTYSSKNPANANWTPAEAANAGRILDSLRGLNVDWRDYFFQTGKFMEQQASLSGGNENVRFFNSVGYYKQDGVAVRSGLERYTLRSNVDFNMNKFSGGVNVTIGYSNSSFTEGVGESRVGSSMASVFYALPYEYPYAPDGTLIHFGNEDDYNILDQREGSAGLERLLNSSSKSELFSTNIGMNLAYQITPQLRAHTRLGIDYKNTVTQDYINPDSYYGSRNRAPTIGGKGLFGEGYARTTSLISTSGLTYQNTFADEHNVEFSGYFEYLYDRYRAFGYQGYGIDGRLPETPAGVNVSPTFLPGINGGRTRSALASFLGTGRYSYANKYSLTASYRYDGSTKVAKENRWHGFYSVGANWNVKGEDFLQGSTFIQGLNVRASYGTTASQFASDFLYLATYKTDISYGGETAIRPVTPGNPQFDWEYVDEFNAGFDLELFPKKRLRISADYYNKLTKNMFIDQPLSMTSGFDMLSLSSGKMRNRGIEFSVQGDVINKEDFGFSLGVNGAYNKNKILFLSDVLTETPDGDTRILKVGMPYGTYYAPEWAGVNPDTGEPQYYNRDGSITTTYDESSQSVTKSGTLYPSFIGGFTTGLRWKDLTLDALFSFVTNVQRWNNEDFYNENADYMTSNQSIRMLENRWKKAGDQAILQRIDIPRQYTSKDIQDASFLRLRNVNLSYNLPQSALSKIGFVKGVRIFFQGQNLLTWTSWRGLDPENSEARGRFQYPAPRTYTAGLNVKF